MTDAQTIARCIAGVARSKDGRGPWQRERACFNALRPGTTPTIAGLTAKAAQLVGEVIAVSAKSEELAS